MTLACSDDGGVSWHNIETLLDVSPGFYVWTVPFINSGLCLIKITNSSNATIHDRSDQHFAIHTAGLKLLEPNGGEEFISGEKVDILWESTEIVEVNIYISYNNGASWEILTSDLSSTGIWEWPVPAFVSNQARIKVEDADGATLFDTSDMPFRIIADPTAVTGECGLPHEYALHPNYPNLFNPVTELEYMLPEQTHVRMEIFNISGGKVISLVDSHQDAGFYTVKWDVRDDLGRKVSDGIYLCRFRTAVYNRTIRMVLLR